MPYGVFPTGERWCVHKVNEAKEQDGEAIACHDTEGEADAQMAALYANEPKAKSQTVSIKALTDTTATLAGYGVLFGGQDLQGEQFTKGTDFDLALVPVKSIFHEHTLGSVKHALGKAVSVAADDAGLWVEMELDRSRAYVKEILTLVEKGVLGLSSGSIQHLIRRAGKTITAWPIVEFSLTPTPAEPRTLGVEWVKSMTAEYPAFKAFLPEAGGEPAADATAGAMPAAIKSTHEVKPMEITQEILDKLAQDAGASAVKAVMDLPAIKAGFAVQVTKDAGDQPFASLGEQLGAVKAFYLSGGMSLDARLAKHSVKATGLNEAIGSEGGFLLQPSFTADLLKPMHETGVFTSRVRKLPVSTNANSGWINGIDETSRATGSRWGGIRGYRLAEGGTKTASKPAFRRINWQLKKYAVLVYATDELLEDAAQLEEVIRLGASEELDFMANDDVLNGAGNAGPLGILVSPSLVTVDKETNQAADTIIYENLTKMWARLASRSRGNAAWFYNADAGGQLDTLVLAAGTGGLPPNFIRYGNDGLMTIYGRPAIPTEFNATLGDPGDIVLADMTEYLFWEKGGVQAAQSIHVQFLTDETVFRFVYRCDGQPAWASASTPYKGSATQSPFVALAARA